MIKPNHLGTCTETSDDQVNHFDVTPWHLSGPIIWRLNRSTVPTNLAGSVDGVLSDSFNTWYGGVFSQGPDTNARAARFDKVNAILWKRLGRSTIGVTYAWFSRSSGEVLEVDTLLNDIHGRSSLIRLIVRPHPMLMTFRTLPLTKSATGLAWMICLMIRTKT